MTKFRIVKQTSSILLIERSKVDSFIAIALAIALIAIGFITLPESVKGLSIISGISLLAKQDAHLTIFLFFMGFILLFIELISLKGSAQIKNILFLKSRKRIYKNWKYFCDFSEIFEIQIVERNFENEDESNQYQLKILYVNGKSEVIDWGHSKESIYQLGDVIAEILEKDIIEMPDSIRG